MKKIAISLILAAGLLSSCIYPFQAEIPEIEGTLVAEGDIVVGGTSTFKLSWLEDLNSKGGKYGAPDLQLSVESSDGSSISGKGRAEGSIQKITLNTSACSPDKQYRIRITGNGSNEYVSEWSSPEGTCIIDDVTHSPGKTGADILVSIHSEDGSKYFRYSYTTTWEFHSPVQASLYFSYDMGRIRLKPFEDGENNYYCWKSEESDSLRVVTTEDLSQNVIKGYRITTIPYDSKQLQILTRMDVSVCVIPEDLYRYYDHLKTVSSYNGDLFSPNPDQMRGNMRNTADESDMVIGYIPVLKNTVKTIYIDNKQTDYYTGHDPVVEQIALSQGQWTQYYKDGFLPIYGDEQLGWYWAEGRCVDCTRDGGSKTKPEGWPNDHK